MSDTRKPFFSAERRRRGIYLLPNAVTMANLFAGFYAIVQAMNGNFEHAAVAVFVAMVLDGLDGRVARLTHTQSEFGVELDSLCDMTSFGAAPALIMYEWALRDMGRLGWIAAFVYCACAALRLARFNTNVNVVDSSYFQGLPSPAAAGLMAGMIWVMHDLGWSGSDVRLYALALTFFAGVTMFTTVPYWSGKNVNLRQMAPFIAPALILLAFVLISFYPPGVLFALFLAYGASGYLWFIWKKLARKKPQ